MPVFPTLFVIKERERVRETNTDREGVGEGEREGWIERGMDRESEREWEREG